MTCREKLAQEHPKCVDSDFVGGCKDCPSTYGYLKNPEDCTSSYYRCSACWDREIPETMDISVECTTCVHCDVCAYRESFIDIIGATQHSNGICAHVGSEITIDLNSTPYLKLDISCKYYRRKGEV